ncbi:hypothetical protein BDN70DRAFT_973398, partial [Pholiota conissans]
MSSPWDELHHLGEHANDDGFECANYAILSHTWLRSAPGEVTFNDWEEGNLDLTHPGYRKLANFCRVASEDHDVTLGWMDTVCIDKSSSAELDESIRSMFSWYRNSDMCIAYLAESTSVDDMSNDTWLTRGWTLQELIASSSIKFYDRNWNQLTEARNDKSEDIILSQIESTTTITEHELKYPFLASISRRMQWAAGRQVTREEDSAYCLMGIFRVNMSIAYGEGSFDAFTRLLKEILSSCKSGILDVFNWGG